MPPPSAHSLPMETDADSMEPLDRKLEESGLKDTRTCLFPPINPPPSQRKDKEDPDMIAVYEHQKKVEDNKCLLAELVRIEQELRESLRREEEKQQVLDRMRQEENRLRWRNLCYLSFNQRATKPFVSSYFKNIPMHIYCLPIQSVARRQKKKKKRTR